MHDTQRVRLVRGVSGVRLVTPLRCLKRQRQWRKHLSNCLPLVKYKEWATPKLVCFPVFTTSSFLCFIEFSHRLNMFNLRFHLRVLKFLYHAKFWFIFWTHSKLFYIHMYIISDYTFILIFLASSKTCWVLLCAHVDVICVCAFVSCEDVASNL